MREIAEKQTKCTVTASASTSDATDNVWEAARRLGLFGLSEAELDAVIHQHCDSPQRADRIAAEAARYIRGLRAGFAAGDVC